MAYLGANPTSKIDSQSRLVYVATAGQTVFAANYTPGNIDVYLNGIKLHGPTGVDFTAIDGTSVTLSTPCVAGETVEIVAVKVASPYDVYPRAQVDSLVQNFFAVATGTADSIAVAPAPAITVLLDGMEIRVRTVLANATSTPTVTISSLGVTKNITNFGGIALPIGAWVPGQEITLRYHQAGNRFELMQSRLLKEVQSITATVGSNSMTITLNPTTLDFRSSSLSNGVPNIRHVTSAISIVVPATATLGTSSGVLSGFAILAFDNNGVIELGVSNVNNVSGFDESILRSSTAISTSASSQDVIYTTFTRTSLPVRVVGYVEFTQTTAGLYATAPSKVQGSSSNSISALSLPSTTSLVNTSINNKTIGWGQSWQSLLGSRAFNTNFFNTTTRPIMISFWGINAGAVNLTIDGVVVNTSGINSSVPSVNLVGIVPVNSSYSISSCSSPILWAELR